MRLHTRGLAVLAATALVLTACGDDDDDAGGSEETTDLSGQVTVWADPDRTAILEEVGTEFTDSSGVEVTVVEKASDTIREDFATQAPQGQGPDVIIGAHDWLGEFVDGGLVVPVDLAGTEDNYQEVAIEAFSYDGQTYGLPLSTENLALLRNTDLAPDQPADWDDLVATGQSLVDSGDAKLPLAVETGTEGNPYHYYPLQSSYGAVVFGQNEDGSWNPAELLLDNDGGIQFANDLAKWGKEGIVSTSVTGDIATTEFTEGRAPYWITGPWNVGAAQDAGVNFTVEEIPGPGGEYAAPFVGAQGAMVSAFSENQLAANEFVVNFLGTEDVSRKFFELQARPPALTAVLEEVSDDPIIAAFGTIAAQSNPLPNIPEMAAVFTFWGETEASIIDGQGNPENLWNTMADNIRAEIAN
jgi:arabinogalactan oligomer/maltooligosaccharide transport system substrate-binding protein